MRRHLRRGMSRTGPFLKRSELHAQNIKVLLKLFQKLAGVLGAEPPGRPPQRTEHPRITKAQEGRPNRPGDGLAVGNPSEGGPIPGPAVSCQFLSPGDSRKRGIYHKQNVSPKKEPPIFILRDLPVHPNIGKPPPKSSFFPTCQKEEVPGCYYPGTSSFWSSHFITNIDRGG